MDLAFGYDPASERTIHTVLQRIFLTGGYSGGYHDHTLYRLSEDDGRTWTGFRLLRYEDGPDFDPDNWVNPDYLSTNQVYGGYNVEALRNGTLALALPGGVPARRLGLAFPLSAANLAPRAGDRKRACTRELGVERS